MGASNAREKQIVFARVSKVSRATGADRAADVDSHTVHL
tara:strand:- start:9840 stop:9956 length:117 start_codon:yes stop_codon:yes gene_type:complete